MPYRLSVLVRPVAWLMLAVVALAGCMASVPGSSPGFPDSSPGVPGPSVVPASPSAGSPLPERTEEPSDGPIGQFAAIEGANLLVRADRESAPAVSGDEIAALTRSNAEFALDLYRELAAGSDQNIVVGPHSISTALAMVYAGARGETAAEMGDVLHFDALSGDVSPAFNALDLALTSRSQEGVVDLRLANQGFAAPGLPFLDSYLETLGRDFGAPMAELDFLDTERARDVINAWAADRTNDRITELFPAGAISAQTVLVIVNAVAMDAAWRYVFDPAQTSDEPFQLADGTVVQVPTMRFDLYLPLVWDEEFAAVELLYGAGDLSMVVILPNDLTAFDAEVDPARLQWIFDAISEQGIHLSLPKFAFKSHTDLDDTLKQLGMTSVYEAADFSGMTGTPDLFLETVQHEAFIEVDEEGTEAHAATGAGMAVSHGPTITVDRPFFFVIRDRPTGAILFLGRVTDPRG
jgi:serpin B